MRPLQRTLRPVLQRVSIASHPPARHVTRDLSTTPHPLAAAGGGAGFNPRNASLTGRRPPIIDPIAEKLSAFTLDHDITTPTVRVKDGDQLGAPEDLRTLLASIDRTILRLVQINKPDANQPHAVVEIVSEKELLRRRRDTELAARQQERGKKVHKPKQIELNWAIGPNDLALKMRQMEQFLAKGKKVEILLAARRHQRKATEDEAAALLRQLRERIDECDAKEIAPMEGKVLGQATLVVKRKD